MGCGPNVDQSALLLAVGSTVARLQGGLLLVLLLCAEGGKVRMQTSAVV
jgi:hypothetical protein